VFLLGNIGFWILLGAGVVETDAFTSQPTLQGCWRDVLYLWSSRDYTWRFTAQELELFNSNTAVGVNYEFNPRRKAIDLFAEKKEHGVITWKVLLLTKHLLVIRYHNTRAPEMQVWGDWVDEDKGRLVVLLRIRAPTQ
jgi:hypothetical protein